MADPSSIRILTRASAVQNRSPAAPLKDASGPVFEKINLRLGFRWFAIASFDLQLADAAIGEGNVIAHFTEVFSLDEFSFGSGVTVEVLIMPMSA